MAKPKRAKLELVDGLGPKDIKRIRSAIRMTWHWSYAKKLCAKRSMHSDGFPYCEKCGEKVAKIYVDHIVAVGKLDDGFIKRLFCPSTGLQALCKKCHDLKTKEERSAQVTNE